MNRDYVSQLYEAVRKINYAYESWASSHGLTLYEMEIYYIIVDQNIIYITQKELCDKLDAPKTSINSIVKRQLKTGYIEMKVNPDNKREKIISLTDSGKKFVKEVITPLFKYEEEVIARFNQKEIENVIKTQEKFADILSYKVGIKK